jgi:hypothetical protein
MENRNGVITNVQVGINNTPSDVRGGYSDGYHTFNELYDVRLALNASLFNEWASAYNDYKAGLTKGVSYFQEVFPKYDVHKALRHYDGERCFGGHWFIVVAKLDTGLISFHYPVKHWGKFDIPVYDKCKYEFDGHTTQDVIERLLTNEPGDNITGIV